MANNRDSGNTSKRGFAGMDKAKQREIAAKGGRSKRSSSSQGNRSGNMNSRSQ